MSMLNVLITKLLSALTFAFFTLSLVGCDVTYSGFNENMKQPITSCNAGEMNKINITRLDSQQKTQVCKIMVSAIHRLPPIYLLRDFARLVSMVKSTASNDSVTVIANDAITTVKLRQQTNNNEAMQSTFDTLWKIYQDTQTQVTFRDLNNALRQPGIAPSSISDEELIKLGIKLYRNKS